MGGALSGIMGMAASPESPFCMPFLSWFWMVPWLYGIQNASDKHRVFSGLILFFFYKVHDNFSGVYSAVSILKTGNILSFIITSLFFLPYALPFILIGILLPFFRNFKAADLAAFISIAVFAFHWTPMVFPITPAVMLAHYPRAIQIADIGGIPIIDFLLMLINMLILLTIIRIQKKRRCLAIMFCLAVTSLIIFVYGTWRIKQFESASGISTVQVGLAQPDLPHHIGISGLISRHQRRPLSALDLSESLVDKTGSDKIDLIIWPEISEGVLCDDSGKVSQILKTFTEKNGSAVIYNCRRCDSDSIEDKECNRSARFVKADGDVFGLYDKRALVPYVEALPINMIHKLIKPLIPVTGKLLRGNNAVVFPLTEMAGIIPLICYDALFPEFVREGVQKGGTIIVVMANNALFGKSNIAALDFALNIYRAVEFKKPMARVSNSGPSGLVDATGRIIPGSLTKIFEKDAGIGRLKLNAYQTVYAKHGDWFLGGITFFFIYYLIYHLLRRRK